MAWLRVLGHPQSRHTHIFMLAFVQCLLVEVKVNFYFYLVYFLLFFPVQNSTECVYFILYDRSDVLI